MTKEEFRLYMREWRKNNPDKVKKSNEQSRTKYHENIEASRAKRREDQKRWRQANPERARELVIAARQKKPAYYLWLRAKQRADLRGVGFTIKPEDILIPRLCPIFGIVLDLS